MIGRWSVYKICVAHVCTLYLAFVYMYMNQNTLNVHTSTLYA